MKPGVTIEDIEKHDDTVLIHRIANMGVFYGVPCDGCVFDIRCIIQSSIDTLLEAMGDAINDESRTELRERIRRLMDEGRLQFRSRTSCLDYITLTPEEWDRIVVDDAERVRSYLEATADLKIRAAEAGVEMPDKTAETMVKRWFAAKP